MLLGALEGDFFKGPIQTDTRLARGIQLHRAIDAYTDSHPQVSALKQAFPGKLRRYAGILIDLAFDHLLSRHWDRYHQHSLTQFSETIYQLLARDAESLSPDARRMADRIRQHDLLQAYHDFRAVAGSARRIGNRFRRGNPFDNIGTSLDPLHPQLEAAFLEFYPQLQQFAREYETSSTAQ